jgi:hypothetical protein
LCFALRPAGLANESGFERDNGCPGGAFGLRMLSKTGRADLLVDLVDAAFLVIDDRSAFLRRAPDASSRFRLLSINKLKTRD